MQHRQSQKNIHRAPRTVTLLDPVFRTGLLEVPLEKTLPTKGRDEWLDGRLNKDLSLCCLFQKGRCHAQDRCFQVHVDRDVMTALREQQSRIVSCCRNCNDTASLSSQAMNFFSEHIPSSTAIRVTYNNGTERVIDCNSIAFTGGLVQQFEEHGACVERGTLEIPARRICRLHLRGCCKYGKDCKNVHACSKLGEKFLDAPAPNVVAPHVVAVPRAVVPAYVKPATVVATRPLHQFALVEPQVKVSPPMPSFAPVTTVINTSAAQPQQVRSNPLTLGIADRNAVSVSLKSMDALDFCEVSTRMMKSFLFDANAALEDSSKTGCWYNSSNGDSNEASTLMSAASPGQKRRSIPHAMHLDALHPCSQATDQFPACRITQWDQWGVVNMFA